MSDFIDPTSKQKILDKLNEHLVNQGAPTLTMEEYDTVTTLATVGAAGYGVSRIADFFRHHNDPRERMANQLFMRGHATVDEIMLSSYGEWPLKGLDLVENANPQRVNFGNILNMPGYERIENPAQRLGEKSKDFDMYSGMAQISGERFIGMNMLRLEMIPGLPAGRPIASTMGHEATHIMQGDYSFHRANDIFGDEIASAIRAANNNITNPKSDMTVFETLIPDALDHDKMNALSTGQKKRMMYFLEGSEMQARVHEIMAEGYQRWGQMPQNKEQLATALLNSGVEIPKSVKRDLNQSPTINETRAIFDSGGRPAPSGPARDLNRVQSVMNPEGKETFWNKTMPGLYSDLIEMYGDKQGRERFGLGHNVIMDYRLAREEMVGHPGPMLPTSAAADSNITAGKTANIATEFADKARHVKGGFIVDAALGAGAGILAYTIGSDLKEAGKVTFQTAVPYGDVALKLEAGDKRGAINSAMTETAGIGGAIGGAVAGIAIGSLVFPVVGTAIGATVGGIAGAVGLGVGMDKLLEEAPVITDVVEQTTDNLTRRFRANAPGTSEQIAEEQKNLLENAGLDQKIDFKGRKADAAEILRDPQQRGEFIKSLEERAKNAENPDVRESIEKISAASATFVEMEEKRMALINNPQADNIAANNISVKQNLPPRLGG